MLPQAKSNIKAGDGHTLGQYKFFTSSQIQSKYINSAEYFKPGLIFGTGGSPSIHFCNTPFSTSTDCLVMYAKDNTNLEFVYQYLKSRMYLLERGFRGAGLKHISKSYILDIQIEVPESKTQEKAVETFNILENIIIKKNQQIVLLNDIIKSRFNEMFGSIAQDCLKYPLKKLGAVSDVGSSHRVFTHEFAEDGIPFYRGTEIGELAAGRQPSKPFYITEEHYLRLIEDGTKPMLGDLLMPSICNKGQVWMVDTKQPFYYKDGRVLSISPNREIFNPKYLQCYLREKTIVEYPKMGSGSTFAEFKIFLLKDLDIAIPPIELQNQFADFVAQVDKSKLAVQQSLNELETLKKSLMQQYFG